MSEYEEEDFSDLLYDQWKDMKAEEELEALASKAKKEESD